MIDYPQDKHRHESKEKNHVRAHTRVLVIYSVWPVALGKVCKPVDEPSISLRISDTMLERNIDLCRNLCRATRVSQLRTFKEKDLFLKKRTLSGKKSHTHTGNKHLFAKKPLKRVPVWVSKANRIQLSRLVPQ